MPGEVIRDVIVRVSIQQGDARGIEQAAKGHQAVTTAMQAAGKAAQVTGQQQQQALTPVERELEKCERLIKEMGEEYAKTGRKGGAELDFLIKRQKDLNNVIAERNKIIGGGNEPKPPKPGEVKPFGGALAGLEAASSAISKIAVPIAIVSMVPAVAKQISDALGTVNRVLFGDKTTDNMSPADASPFYTDKVTDSPLLNLYGNVVNTRAGRAYADSPLGGIGPAGYNPRDFANRFAEARRSEQYDPSKGPKTAEELLAREVQLRQQQLSLLEQSHAKQKAQLQTEQQLTEERIRLNQQVIQAEEAKLDAAREQYGLLDSQEQQKFKDAAGKIKSGGLGSLSKDELKLLQGNQAFTGLFSDEAKKQADAAGFKEIIASLGLDKKLKQAEEQIELNADIQHKITLELNAVDAIEKKVREGVEDVMKKLSEEMLKRVQLEIGRAVRQAKGGGGPDF